MYIELFIYLFRKIISTNGILQNIHYYLSQYFFDLEEMIFENFNISENNIISVELAQGTRLLLASYQPKINLRDSIQPQQWIFKIYKGPRQAQY
jgi:uncharacterized membrane protein YobD (UPF0266 family)